MFRRTYDWAMLNRPNFGQMSFSFALTFLWVMTVILIMNVASFASASVDLGALVAKVVSVVPDIASEYVPKLTADIGMGALFIFFLTTCVVAPLVEEMFRAALLQTFCEEKVKDPTTGKVVGVKMKNFFVIGAMSFIFFGMLHGGYVNILIQGVLGLVLARQWFNVGKSYWWKYFSMVAVHGAYNFCMVGIQLMVLRAIS